MLRPARPKPSLARRITLHHQIEAMRFACPHCARLLDVEIKLKGEAPLVDVEIKNWEDAFFFGTDISSTAAVGPQGRLRLGGVQKRQ